MELPGDLDQKPNLRVQFPGMPAKLMSYSLSNVARFVVPLPRAEVIVYPGGRVLRKALFVVVGALLASGQPVAAQRMENGNVRPVSDGIVQEVSMMLQPQSGQPQSAKMPVDSAGAKSIRIRISLAKNATPRTDYIVAVRDRNGGLVARYPAAELGVKKEVWSPPVPGASVEVEVETAAADTVGIAIAVTGIIAQRTPGDPMLSVLGETFDLEPIEAFRLQKPEIFKAGLAVAKLMFVRDGKSLACTGFMIDDDRMLTNEHCINSQAVCRAQSHYWVSIRTRV